MDSRIKVASGRSRLAQWSAPKTAIVEASSTTAHQPTRSSLDCGVGSSFPTTVPTAMEKTSGMTKATLRMMPARTGCDRQRRLSPCESRLTLDPSLAMFQTDWTTLRVAARRRRSGQIARLSSDRVSAPPPIGEPDLSGCGRAGARRHPDKWVWGEGQVARLTAEITARSEAVTMLESNPTPHSTCSPTAHSTYAAAVASPPADSACSA